MQKSIVVDKKEIRYYNKVNYRTEGSDHMQQVISVGNQDFKSIRERAGKVIRILKLSWKICFMESR